MFCTTQYQGSELVSEIGGQMWPPLYVCVYTSAIIFSTLMHNGLPQ